MKYLECAICSKKFDSRRPEFLLAHLKTYHPKCSQSEIDKSLGNFVKAGNKKTPSNKKKEGVKNKHKNKKVSKQPTKFNLINRRGKKISEKKTCTECNKPSIPVWRFWTTDQQIVYLCEKCKAPVLDRSKKTDAMDHRVAGNFFRG